MKYAMLVLKNLTRNKRRTALTVISIGVSLFVFSALVSLPTVANEVLADTASSTRLAVHNKAGLTYGLPEAYRTRIGATPHVVAVMGQSWFGGIYHEVSDAFPNLAVDPEPAPAVWPDWGISKEAFDQFEKVRTAALVGPDTMKRFDLHVGQQIMLRGTIYPQNVTLQIVGTTGGKAPPPNFLLFRRDYLEAAKGPSVTLGLPPENETRAPIEGGWRPSRASSTPAFCRDSLYFVIAATALGSGIAPGSAFSYPLGIINIINRISDLLRFGCAAGFPDGVSTGLPCSTIATKDVERDRHASAPEPPPKVNCFKRSSFICDRRVAEQKRFEPARKRRKPA